jgi:hypothetical protein
MPAVLDDFDKLVGVEKECMSANIDENDHTVFACPDLQFELELLEQAIVKKISFLENQVREFVSTYGPVTHSLLRVDCLQEHDESNTGATGAIRDDVPLLRQGRNKYAKLARNVCRLGELGHCLLGPPFLSLSFIDLTDKMAG